MSYLLNFFIFFKNIAGVDEFRNIAGVDDYGCCVGGVNCVVSPENVGGKAYECFAFILVEIVSVIWVVKLLTHNKHKLTSLSLSPINAIKFVLLQHLHTTFICVCS